MSFVHRKIALKFQLGKGSFGEGGFDTVDLTGLRCTANVTKVGGISMAECDLRVFGMPLDLMNKLTLINTILPDGGRRNRLTVFAGDDQSGMSVCFTGGITEAWADLSAAPDGAFIVRAQAGVLSTLKPVPPTSYSGSIDVATILAGLAALLEPSANLENSGVNIHLSNQYLSGTAMDQIKTVTKAANINAVLDPEDTLAIWPFDGFRRGQEAIISPETGLVGYPAFSQNLIQLTTLYNPSIVFGAVVQVSSTLTTANGRWRIASVAHNLDSETPGGQWFTRVQCNKFGQPTSIIASP